MAVVRGRLDVHAPVHVLHAVIQAAGAVQQLHQGRRQLLDLLAPGRLEQVLRQPVAVVAGLGGGHLAFPHGPLHQQPRGQLHQPGGEPHALGRIGQSGLARQPLGVVAARAV